MSSRNRDTAIAFWAMWLCAAGAIVMTNLYITGEVDSVLPAVVLAVGTLIATVIFYLTYAKRQR